MNDENFANHPKSVGELRAEKSERPQDWSPRDALIAVLRLIDKGEIAPDVLVISYGQRAKDGRATMHDYFSAGGQNIFETTGVVMRTLHRMEAGADGH